MNIFLLLAFSKKNTPPIFDSSGYSWFCCIMSGIYEEIEIEDMDFDLSSQIYYYPCPCGDRFRISLEDLNDGEDVAICPSCSLRIRVIFSLDSLPKLDSNI